MVGTTEEGSKYTNTAEDYPLPATLPRTEGNNGDVLQNVHVQ